MKPTKDNSMSTFFKSVRKSYHSSRGGTIAAEKMNIVQSPSLPVLHHQDRKEKQPCQ